MVKIVENITELVGNSPIIKLKNGPENGAEIYLKLEYFNPGGSVKDLPLGTQELDLPWLVQL